jgi:ribosomal protein S12 methylthiotransferase accessory factor YcaO
MTPYQQRQIEHAFAAWHKAHVDRQVADELLAAAQHREAQLRKQLAGAVFHAGLDAVEVRGHFIVRAGDDDVRIVAAAETVGV